MVKSFEVNANPKAIKFAIEQSGYDSDILANKIGRQTKRFTKIYLWELLEGKRKPLYSDLKKLDSFLKRGIPFFFLENMPKENVLPMFRLKNNNLRLSPETEIKLRKYEDLRKEIKYLLQGEKEEYIRVLPVFDIKQKPEDVAKEIRKKFLFDDIHIEKSTHRDVFAHIRRKIENSDIYVFKDSLENGLRGCIFIKNNLPPLILINSNDDKNAEIYSLLHEFGHFLLDDEELDLDEDGIKKDEKIELWCNAFAYHFIMKNEFEIEENFTKENKAQLTDIEKLKELSEKYKISKHALMLRFYLLGIITANEYYEFKNRFPYKFKDKNKPKSGDYYKTNRDRLSRKFISLVYATFSDGKISLTETFNYLHVKDNHRIDQLLEVVDNG